MRTAVMAPLLALAALGCGPRNTDALSWRFEARASFGEIRVVPVVPAYVEPTLRVDGHVLDHVPWRREEVRLERMTELEQIPNAIGVSLPGALHTQIDGDWSGRFGVGKLSHSGRDKLAGTLRKQLDPDPILSDLARSVGGDAVMFVWVTELAGTPITAEAFPGDVVETTQGPVVVELMEEPYRVRAEVGMALVASDGEVVLRYTDEFESVLGARYAARRAGRHMAMALADEVIKMWPLEPDSRRSSRKEMALAQ
jgi:hypothetical protein